MCYRVIQPWGPMGNMSGLRRVCKRSQWHLRAVRVQLYVIGLCWRFKSDPGMCRRPHVVTSLSSVRLPRAEAMTKTEWAGRDLLVGRWNVQTYNKLMTSRAAFHTKHGGSLVRLNELDVWLLHPTVQSLKKKKEFHTKKPPSWAAQSSVRLHM